MRMTRKPFYVLLGLASVSLVAAVAQPGLRAAGAARLRDGRTALQELGGELGDAQVTARVRTALDLRRELRPLPLEASTRDGVVTISGAVGSQEQVDLARKVVQAVPGVRRVETALALQADLLAPEGPSLSERARDRALAAEARLAFSLHRELKDAGLTVHAERGELSVEGRVDTREQRSLALEVAAGLPHARGVRDETYFGCPQPPPLAPRLEKRAEQAMSALQANPHLAARPLAVRVEEGRLRLQGTVESGIEKDLALALAGKAAGVEVEDEIEVRS